MDEKFLDHCVLNITKYRKLPYYENSMELQYIDYKMSHKELYWEDVITCVNIGLDQEFYTNIKQVSELDSLTVLVNKYHQLPEDYIPEDLEVINRDFNIETLMLRHDARKAFEEMCCYTRKIGLCLKAISSFRSYDYQEEVYYRKITPDMDVKEYQKNRDKVSARAGHSEHQTGLAVDINDLEEIFETTPQGQWLAENSYRFGFILRYPKGKEWITGYSYEPWHFRYVGHYLAESIYYSNLTYDEYYVRHLKSPIQ